MNARLQHRGSTPVSPLILVVDSPDHPFELGTITQEMSCAVATAYVDSWNEQLAPWQAPGLYHGERDFGDGAAQTLSMIEDELVPSLIARESILPSSYAIAGYSLAGLFSLYALLNSTLFRAAASVSGSLWYDGWTAYLKRHPVPQDARRFAYLSVGSKEKRAARPRLKTVEERTRLTESLLRERGMRTELYLGPGGHLQHTSERLARALASLQSFLQGA